MDSLLKLVYTLGKNDQITIRQLSINSNIPYTTAYRLIRKNPSLFAINKKGNIKLISLNHDDNITKNYLILSERREYENFIRKNPQLRILKKDLPDGNYTLILFGSRAEGTHRKKSDIDLCIINTNGSKNVSFSKFQLLFKIEVNALYFSEVEFSDMMKAKDRNVAKEILAKHIILYGEEYFWNLIWNV